jgi:hypothetical protein
MSEIDVAKKHQLEVSLVEKFRQKEQKKFTSN